MKKFLGWLLVLSVVGAVVYCVCCRSQEKSLAGEGGWSGGAE